VHTGDASDALQLKSFPKQSPFLDRCGCEYVRIAGNAIQTVAPTDGQLDLLGAFGFLLFE